MAPRVRLELEDGTSATGDILIGADGVGSVIRAQLHPEEAPAHPSGYFAVRGESPALAQLGGLQALWYFGRGVESGVIQASARSIYWFVSLWSEDVRRGPLDVTSVMQRCTAGFDPQFHAITGATPPDHMRLDELFAREPLDRWGAGPVTLLGDAAHPMLPHTGQGAAQALEDAVALGRVLKSGGDHRRGASTLRARAQPPHPACRQHGSANRGGHDHQESRDWISPRHRHSPGAGNGAGQSLHADRQGPAPGAIIQSPGSRCTSTRSQEPCDVQHCHPPRSHRLRLVFDRGRDRFHRAAAGAEGGAGSRTQLRPGGAVDAREGREAGVRHHR